MRYLLRNAAYAFRSNIYLVLGLIVLEAVAPIFIDLNIGVKLFLYLYTLYVFHRSILPGSPFSGVPRPDP